MTAGWVVVAAVVLALLVACAPPVTDEPPAPMATVATGGAALTITSSAFGQAQAIPTAYTCDGENISPPLIWQGVPAEAESLALIMDDPDAPGRTWVHWVAYNIPTDTGGLPEGVPGEATLPTGTRQGQNSGRAIGYAGPCPPGGTHRYFFKLYALDTALTSLPDRTDKAALLSAMEGHILAEAELMGTYSRQ